MAKRKKKDEKIFVKKPKIGESYWFWFAGGIIYGKLYEKCEKLTNHYNEPYYKLIDNKGTKYPVSIFKLRNERPTYKGNV